MKNSDFLLYLRKRLKRGRIIEYGGSRCDKLPSNEIPSLGILHYATPEPIVPAITFPDKVLPFISRPVISLPVPSIKDVESQLKELGAAIRAATPTMRELTDAMLALRGIPYYPPLCPRPRPQRQKSRARQSPTRLQRRRNRQTKRKRRK